VQILIFKQKYFFNGRSGRLFTIWSTLALYT
jgi:hypothetical protein